MWRIVRRGDYRPAAPLQQSKVAQLTAQRLGHVLGTGRDAVEVAWRILGRKIAPALERSERARLDQRQLGIERQPAASDALLVHERAHGAQLLTAHDLAADHPIE